MRPFRASFMISSGEARGRAAFTLDEIGFELGECVRRRVPVVIAKLAQAVGVEPGWRAKA